MEVSKMRNPMAELNCWSPKLETQELLQKMSEGENDNWWPCIAETHLTQFAETSNPFYLIHSVSKTPTSGLQLHFTKAHPLDVSMQALNNLLIRMITKMLQYMQPHHKANLLTSMPLSTLIRQQSIDEIVPINVISEKKKFVILLEGSWKRCE